MTGKLIQSRPTPTAKLGWYIVTSDTMYDNPVLQTAWWRVHEIRRGGHALVGEAAKNGVYVTCDTGSDLWSTTIDGTSVEVWFPGRATPVHTEERAVTCPKVRGASETRWYQGAWQKNLKTKGWVRA